jgi:hypothetical protein
MRHIEINAEWASRQPFTVRKQLIFDFENGQENFFDVVVEVDDNKPLMNRSMVSLYSEQLIRMEVAHCKLKHLLHDSGKLPKESTRTLKDVMAAHIINRGMCCENTKTKFS